MNVTNLVVQLQQKIIQGNLTPLQSLIATKTLTQLKTGAVHEVDVITSLPAAAASEGAVYYVKSQQTLYYSTGLAWTVLSQPIYTQTFGWGTNTAGQLGDGTTTSRSSPGSVVGGFTDWCQVSAGQLHTTALSAAGSLWAWGCNTAGGLGICSTVNQSSPVSVVGGFTDWCQVSSGCARTAAVRRNGTLWAWGCNYNGSIGDGTTTNRSSPVSVVGGFTDWCQVSTGFGHTTAIRTNGTLWAWGGLGLLCGELGDGTTTTRSSPVSVVGGFTDWCQVSAGLGFTAAVRCNGTLWAWGGNGSGQLGTGNSITVSSPVSIVGGFTDWRQVSAEDQHAIAIRSNGTLWAWGNNGNGQVGDGTTTTRSSPVSVVGGFTDWCQVSASRHSTAIRTNGTLWAWGCNSGGRLGDGTTVDKSSPVSVVGGFTDWCQVSAGLYHTHAIRNCSFV